MTAATARLSVVVLILGAALLIVVGGMVALALMGREIPGQLDTLAAGLVPGLLGLLVPGPRSVRPTD